MAKINGNYEVAYILKPELGEEATAAPAGLSHRRPERGLLRVHDLYG